MDAMAFLVNPRHDVQAAVGYVPIFDDECRRLFFSACEEMRYDNEYVAATFEMYEEVETHV